MDIWHIRGGNRLEGACFVQCSKNASLPIIAASVICPARTELVNVPQLKDVDAALRILRHLGCVAEQRKNDVYIDSTYFSCSAIPHSLMEEMRSSVIFMGALLARCGEARLSLPGGCQLGKRPIDLHLSALRQMGAEIEEDGQEIYCKARKLHDAIQTHCWDERDGTFYSVDLNFRPVDPTDWLHKGAPRTWNSLLLRVDNWSSFLPMWAGIASAEQAARMVERYRDTRTFNSNYGIRTLSRLEKQYNLGASNNPSNWCGPIWGVSNYMTFRGLQKYGYHEDAKALAEKTVRLFGQDLEQSGSLHEYYHPDTGEPIMTHGFQNWNFLVLNMIAWLEGRKFVDTF